ncbi:hypothetical protein BDV34DRAFT_202250 [Aspergillus parasiticus]|uniref:Uncharacterized protein n=1 Tax=Aspergillus parasiticus TaxID=5067 RepID=A0A5N6D9B5_ASPPA|nr:hypothetical protein BDV34DRAFT_202250 [Aspergillus parasiticus]
MSVVCCQWMNRYMGFGCFVFVCFVWVLTGLSFECYYIKDLLLSFFILLLLFLEWLAEFLSIRLEVCISS